MTFVLNRHTNNSFIVQKVENSVALILKTPRQKFENATAKVSKRHGKNLKTSRQKLQNVTAKVSKRHGKSLKMPRQKFENATAKVSKHHGKRFSTAEVKLQDGSEYVSRQSQSSPSKPKWRTGTQLQKRKRFAIISTRGLLTMKYLHF